MNYFVFLQIIKLIMENKSRDKGYGEFMPL